MPERRQSRSLGPDSGAGRTERLNQAIDRMLDGQPVPVQDDPDLQDLLQLAGRLRAELPLDLPDPAFRAGLQQQLTHRSAIVPRPTSRSWTSVPYLPTIGAIAAVLIVAIVVGSIGVWSGDDPERLSPVEEAVIGSDDALTMSAVTLATSTPANFTAMTAARAPTEAEQTRDEMNDPGAATTPTPTRVLTATVAALPTATTAPQPATAATPATLSTSVPQVASISVPPLDADHIELGPGPAASGAGTGPSDDVTATLATAMPDMGRVAAVYELAPPHVDPVELVSRVASALELDGEVASGPNAFGDTDYMVTSSSGDTFIWTPSTGTFSYYNVQDESEAPDPSDVVERIASGWLEEIGYPVEQLQATGAEQRFDDATQVTAVLDDLPLPEMGHPVGVNVVVAPDGQVIEVTGYWLDQVRSHETPLRSPEDAWDAIKRGEGFWFDGGISAAGGEFRVDTLRLSYLVTRSPDEALVLQPVVTAKGEFAARDGTSARITVFVQAVEPTQ